MRAPQPQRSRLTSAGRQGPLSGCAGFCFVAGTVFLSVVIVNWNSADRLLSCLAALQGELRDCADRDVETIVVDNGSQDDSIMRVRQTMPRTVVVALESNVGFAAGANAGIEVASGEWVALLNNDVVVRQGWVDAMWAAAQGALDPLGMLQSLVVGTEDPSRVDTTGVEITRNGEIRDRSRGASADDEGSTRAVFCASACAALYRRRMLEAVGGANGPFDEAFFMYFEDVDFGWRARLAGWAAELVPDAIALHVGHGSAELQPRDFVKRQCARNRVRVILGNASLSFIASSIPRLMRDAAWLVADGGFRSLPALWDGVRDGLARRREAPASVGQARYEVEREWFGPR